jgi:hypothetical protein
MHRNIFIDTDYTKFIQAEYGEASTCIKHQVTELKDIHDQYKDGFPKSYSFQNTVIHQKFWQEDEIDFIELGQKLGIEAITVSSIVQPPGNTIPIHRDTFYQIKKKYPDRKETIVRANIFLENWKTGHFLQYNDTVHTHWRQGEGHMWDESVLHIGANNGMENKYTLQVSGFLNS